MSIATMILGNSGSGKSTSLRNLDPASTLLIQCINKPLPFRASDWRPCTKATPEGNVVRTDKPDAILKVLQGSTQDIVVIDDYQAVLINELISRSAERGYDKFTDIAKNAWEVFQAAGRLADHRRVYILTHTQTDETGQIRMKTVGKMVDSMIVPEGYFTIVLRTEVINSQYLFATQSNGQDCCKSPMGMFADQHIPNDLAEVDKQICEFYGLTATA
ncbi:ATP-binding protein [Comamonas odontotermitis]|uniref:ATP-binding protein n=1 Tax=Comamonas odontotermitis TaxID=379895 RepID=UPI001CC7B119|nr:ATP-binding protein [Comamonas odontotermitis]UBB15470.1 ATP-binding protein [Comamonas odontotermitis]